MIGFVLGMLTSAQIRFNRLKPVRVFFSEERFREGFYKIIQPDEKQKAEINQLKKDRGYITYANNDGGYYVIIFRGEKPTTGYDITVQSVQDNEGNTNITIQEINPVQGTIQGEAITYPTTAIEIKNIADNFFVTNVKGEEFQKLN